MKKITFNLLIRVFTVALTMFWVQIINISVVYAQSVITVSGKVTDPFGEPVIGASVILKGTTTGALTDMDGIYTIHIPDTRGTLEFRYLGYVNQSVPIGNRTRIDIQLYEDSQNLEEVVVVGYGTMKKSDLTSSISSIKNDVIKSAATNNLGDIIQGKVPGLDVATAQYEGDNRGILIRGERSLKGGNNPLVIIDGVPGDMNNVNPNDIESIEILKDAASAAIYGSQGANGVIILTTKKGKSNTKTNVTYNSYYNFQKAEMIDMMPGEKFAQLRRDAYLITNNIWGENVPDEQIFTAEELQVVQSGRYIDWFDLIFRDASSQSQNISISSGGEKTKFYASLTYESSKGYARTHETKKWFFTTSIDHKLSGWMDIGLTTRLRQNDNTGFITPGQELLYGTPIVDPYDSDGNLIDYPNKKETALNFLYNYEEGQYINDKQSLNTNLLFYADIHPLPYLRMRTNFGYIVNNYNNGHFYGRKTLPTGGSYSESGKDGSNDYNWTFNNTITFDKNFQSHHLVVDGIIELVKNRSNSWSATGQNQDIDYLSYNNLVTNNENKNISSGTGDSSLASFMGRIRYDYKGKYLFNFSVRADGSSKLAEGNKWASFPSGGVAWRISSEPFMEKIEWLTDLKVRYSLGMVGNQAIDPYNSLALLGDYKYMFGDNGFYAYRPNSLSNKQLTWEKTVTSNIGIDFTLWKGKVTGNMEYYTSRTKDLLMDRSLPLTIGYSKISDNIGETKNEGFEMAINYNPVQIQNLRWDLNLIYSTNKNKIVKLNSPNDDITNRWFIGKPIGVIYDYEMIGIWQLGEEEEAAVYGRTPGDIKIKDQTNEEGKIGIGEEDKVILGQTSPKHIASFGTTIQWKELDFSLNLNSRWGHLINHSGYGGSVILNGYRWVADVDYWTPDNPSNRYPKAHEIWPDNRSLTGYMKGDYIKIQDITIGYDFAKILRRVLPVTQVRLYVQGRNLGYLYRAADENIHPESTDMYLTIPRSFIVGVNINF